MLKVLLKRQTSNKLLRIIWNYLELFGIFWIVKYFRNTDTCLNLDKQVQIWTVQTCTNLSEFRMSPSIYYISMEEEYDLSKIYLIY